MKISSIIMAASASAMAVMPVAANAAAVQSNPAAKLSIAPSVRAHASAGKSEKLLGLNGGGAVIAALIVAGIAAIGIVAIVNGDDNNADSN